MPDNAFTPTVRQCQSPDCGLRFPLATARQSGDVCPLCGAPTRLAVSYPTYSPRKAAPLGRSSKLRVLLDNVRSALNVGAIFRTADGAGVSHLHLCGITTTPAHAKVKKTALGAETSVAWSYHRNGLETAVSLQAQGFQLWALETSPQSVPLFTNPPPKDAPILLIVGHETTGVDPAILALCDRVVHLPMHGRKESLNVSTAFGIAAYYLSYQWGAMRDEL